MRRSGPSHDSSLSFGEVVGLDDAKTALILAACEPRLGGVLLRGQKGSAKTTLARGLASLLPDDAPFVELPLGATEDRVIGAIDAAELLSTGNIRVRPGLMATAHAGVLYVDEVNLLADHLVDSLLDAAVSGRNRIERDGVSHVHDARFVLIASMNPEEGELRPQLLDRFGLAVDIVAPSEPDDRVTAVRRQLDRERAVALGNSGDNNDNDSELTDTVAAEQELRARIAAFEPAEVTDELIGHATALALAVGAEGLRADLMLCRAAAALAGWERRAFATADDLRRVARLVLAHRRRRQPFDDPGMSDAELQDACNEALSRPDSDQATEPGSLDEVIDADPERRVPVALLGRNRGPEGSERSGRRDPSRGPRGRYLRSEPAGEQPSDVAVIPTALATAARRRVEPGAPVHREDLRVAVREDTVGRLVVVAVDASASMGAQRRIATAKAAVLGLLSDAYEQRDRVALVVIRGETSEVLLRPTGSVEIARNRLADVPVGGSTPLAHGIETVLDLVSGPTARSDLEPFVVLITDGRATFGGDDPLERAYEAAERFARSGTNGVVVDAETGIPRLGLAVELAARMAVDVVSLDDFEPSADVLRRW